MRGSYLYNAQLNYKATANQSEQQQEDAEGDFIKWITQDS